ncbi:unnamed protein product [Cuscuta epithymum]|uniref:Uncharacterized protein n=1 Tax=Cuscuta epithymum TaxID=186058 RepID=A0AAV0C365_9ASTE|nr:unnamed protein product [Cuscuta epithymum]
MSANKFSKPKVYACQTSKRICKSFNILKKIVVMQYTKMNVEHLLSHLEVLASLFFSLKIGMGWARAVQPGAGFLGLVPTRYPDRVILSTQDLSTLKKLLPP